MTDIFHKDVPMTLDEYKGKKIEMLERDFMMRLTHEQRQHLMGLPNEYAVDRYGRTLILQNMDPNY